MELIKRDQIIDSLNIQVFSINGEMEKIIHEEKECRDELLKQTEEKAKLVKEFLN